VSVAKPLVVTAGEPAGIGPEICLALATQARAANIVVVSDPELLRARAASTGIDVAITEIATADIGKRPADRGELQVLGFPFPQAVNCGQPSVANACTLIDGLRFAVEACLDDRFAGLVTAPLQKSIINDAGIAFTGHTEFLAELTATPQPVMLLVAGDLRVALATTHLPLRAVPDALTRERLRDVLQVLHHGLKTRFRIDTPDIVVCGLNPHAGEGGHLGNEDNDVIAPVIAELSAHGINVRGPVPADTAFSRATGHKDVVVAMYHDQGLPVLKYASFGHAVNVTLGLPFVRTSVDHGTALDLAGSGKADAASLIAAVELAASLT
jgi:4-hydroxythreonine-4-phosphate dehydrogenase